MFIVDNCALGNTGKMEFQLATRDVAFTGDTTFF